MTGYAMLKTLYAEGICSAEKWVLRISARRRMGGNVMVVINATLAHAEEIRLQTSGFAFRNKFKNWIFITEY